MAIQHPIQSMIARRAAGAACGIYSACTANELVLEACMRRAQPGGEVLLVEATANQVNQYGGYTGMQPADFRDFVLDLARRVSLPAEQILLGGDHLGPLTWKGEAAESAMAKAQVLVRDYVLAGFRKIHLDTSMRLADDPVSGRLSDALIAERAARLCRVAEDAWQESGGIASGLPAPVYVVGSEVPVPGGSQDQEETLQVTAVADFEQTLAAFAAAFRDHGLADAWQRVVAVVVQPGVEFGESSVHPYDRLAARPLCQALAGYPGLVFEGHSTDYQTAGALRQMVEDGIAILKVGPGLTFALREGLFSLSRIEEELAGMRPAWQPSGFIEVLEAAMRDNPVHWRQHYQGNAALIRLACKYSFSDRARYYLPLPQVQAAIGRLLANLASIEIPLTLLSQFLPCQYQKVREGRLASKPRDLLLDQVGQTVDLYRRATL